MTYENLFNKVYNNAIKIININTQFENQLKEKLLKKKYPEEIIDAVIIELKKQNYINDQKNIKSYIYSLINNKLYGINRVISILQEKNIYNNEILNTILEEYENCGGEEYILKKFLNKIKKDILILLDNKNIEKIKYKLYNKGFSLNLINNLDLSKIKEFLDN